MSLLMSKTQTSKWDPSEHAGGVLRDELEELEMSARAFAEALSVPANRITAVLNGQRGITADTA